MRGEIPDPIRHINKLVLLKSAQSGVRKMARDMQAAGALPFEVSAILCVDEHGSVDTTMCVTFGEFELTNVPALGMAEQPSRQATYGLRRLNLNSGRRFFQSQR